jgi:hypothetical protein
MGACRNLIIRVFALFLARFSFQRSFFSKSRLWTQPLVNHFVTNLDRLAGQLIQFFFAIQNFIFCFDPDFLCIPPWDQSCGRQLYDDEGISCIGTSALLSLLHPPSLHCDCYRPATLTEESVQKKKKAEKVHFYLRHNKLKKANLD